MPPKSTKKTVGVETDLLTNPPASGGEAAASATARPQAEGRGTDAPEGAEDKQETPPAGADAPTEGADAPEDKKESPPAEGGKAERPPAASARTEGSDAPEEQATIATGVATVFLLADGPLGPKGSVVRCSRRKLADLGLKPEDWRPATAKEIAIGG